MGTLAICGEREKPGLRLTEHAGVVKDLPVAHLDPDCVSLGQLRGEVPQGVHGAALTIRSGRTARGRRPCARGSSRVWGCGGLADVRDGAAGPAPSGVPLTRLWEAEIDVRGGRVRPARGDDLAASPSADVDVRVIEEPGLEISAVASRQLRCRLP